MKLSLDDFQLSRAVFLSKVKKDLNVGVKVKAGANAQKDVIRVWTDTRDWQFSLLGLTPAEELMNFEKLEIQSFGESKMYMKLEVVSFDLLDLEVQRLSPNFAELSDVSVDDAKQFLDGYMDSTVNRMLTEQLFEEYAKDKDQYCWLVL